MPRGRIARKEHDRRQGIVRKMLVGGFIPRDIKRILSNEFGVTRRSIEQRINVARGELQQATGVPREEHKARVGGVLLDAYRTLRAVVDDPSATHGAKINAARGVERIARAECRLYGLFEPERVEVSGRESLEDVMGSVPGLHEEIEHERRRAFDVVQEAKKITGTNGTGTNGTGTNGTSVAAG